MERTSIITTLYIGLSSAYNSMVLENGYPNAGTLAAYFIEAPIVQEKADMRQSTQDSDQGELLEIAIRANIHRDSNFHLNFSNKHVVCYLETSNGERHFFGTKENPLRYNYSRDTGSTNGDARDTSIAMDQLIPNA